MTSPPNVLIIMTDQQRLDSLGCYGNRFVVTPHTDAFAQTATRFDMCCTPYPVCTPARASLWSGLCPHAHGLIDNAYGVEDLFSTRALVSDTVFDWFRAAGYHTAYFGKWHLGEEAPAWADTWRGFNSLGGHWQDGYQAFQGGHYKPDLQTEECIDFLRERGVDGRPFIAVQSFYPPHDPYSAPQRFYEPYRNNGAPFPAYYAAVSALDECTGRILKALDTSGLTDNTLVVFLSDHGETFGSRDDSIHKHVCFDDAIRVPFILRMPDGTGAGTHRGAPIGLEDLAPTLADLCGIEPPRHLHGRSLMPLVCSNGADWRNANYIENRTRLNGYVQRCVRTADWKLILSECGPDGMYDLATDPEELFNLDGVPRADNHDQFRHFADMDGQKRLLATQLLECARARDDNIGVTLAERVIG